MKKDHRWNTDHYESYTSELNREELYKLYPSESWALYRTVQDSKSVIDLGCGNGAMSSIIYKINKNAKYVGIDHQENLINKANKKYKHAKFISKDLISFVRENKKKYDIVMAWSVIKSISKWKYLIKKMIEDSKKYVIFDQRVANVNFVSFDEKILYANYGGKTGPLLCINYKLLKEFLLQQKNDLKKIELMAYESRWGKNVKFNSKKNTFVTTIVLHKKNKKNDEFEGIYEQLPQNMER